MSLVKHILLAALILSTTAIKTSAPVTSPVKAETTPTSSPHYTGRIAYCSKTGKHYHIYAYQAEKPTFNPETGLMSNEIRVPIDSDDIVKTYKEWKKDKKLRLHFAQSWPTKLSRFYHKRTHHHRAMTSLAMLPSSY